MDALYLYKKSPHDDFEILHSLRSIDLYAPYIGKVWIYGDRPGFLTADTSVAEHVPHAATSRILKIGTPVTNTFLLLFLSSLIPELSSEYLFFSDDFYLLQDFPLAQARKDRYLEDMSKVTNRGRGLWKSSLWRTYDLLVRLGYPGYNFEVHVPTYLTKKRVLEAYCAFQDFVTEDRWHGMLGPTAILNHAHKQENMNLIHLHQEGSRCGFWEKPPSYEDIVTQSEGKTFFNFDESAFGENIRRFLAERFSQRSKFEAI